MKQIVCVRVIEYWGVFVWVQKYSDNVISSKDCDDEMVVGWHWPSLACCGLFIHVWLLVMFTHFNLAYLDFGIVI